MNNSNTAQPHGSFLRSSPAPTVAQKKQIAFETVGFIDDDVDLGFSLRGHGLNPLVDAALPLFGLVIGLRRMDSFLGVDKLYGTVRDHIASMDEEVRKHGYDGATQLAYRYALCTFIDEAVMQTRWGSHSLWAERSMLSVYHSETWGGEKFFTVLSRMQTDPKKYRDVLEFKYLCLCLGFKGKYGLQHNQAEALQGLIKKLHEVLRDMRGETPEQLTDAHANVASRRYNVGRQWPWWAPWCGVLALLAVVYVIYAMSLEQTTSEVLRSLDTILKR
ncbi:type IVB secretion system protein IcmH/DotU [Dyella kyungheensis]|uniref:DotU family type IV/VI secretion system protein n=1 Tax=Dyella kyungheensis TaxID=1242174 RepID=A0ABS2JWP1_9GAMM|nr:type IVB secretion system protein IcmH/DotU [Dyella kyungheensis]MBM7123316.1 DotU family type IV/VI secretion system protein [Dyella kyungheensis]